MDKLLLNMWHEKTWKHWHPFKDKNQSDYVKTMEGLEEKNNGAYRDLG